MISALLSALSIGQPILSTNQDAQLFDGLGSHSRKVCTSSVTAQKHFDQGLAFLFAFNHDESIRSFTAATQADPNCAMAWWGIATANAPHINNPSMTPEQTKDALEALSHANRLLSKCTQAEKDLIVAAGTRFSLDEKFSRADLDKKYANAMRAVWKKHPRDADIGAMFAESLMDLRPWNQWSQSGKPEPGTIEVTKTLARVLKSSPNHPLALHLSIHAWEASKTPENAIDSANRLRFLEPGLGHMVHMPSHTYVRTGMWKEAVDANKRAIEADAKYIKRRPEQGFYLVYMAHNHQMLSYAATMRGQSEIAIKGMDALFDVVPEEVLNGMAPMIDGYAASIYEVRVRFGKWDEILAMPEPGENFPIMRTIRYMARSVAYSAKGMPKEARDEQANFYAAWKNVPADAPIGNNSATAILQVAEALMNGELLLAEGKTDRAIEMLNRAVRLEDRTKYNEPPDWLQPTRHALGAVLVRESKFADAERVYKDDLTRLPNNGWSLYGLKQAYEGQARVRDARRFEKAFTKVWADADTKISSSCMCVRGK